MTGLLILTIVLIGWDLVYTWIRTRQIQRQQEEILNEVRYMNTGIDPTGKYDSAAGIQAAMDQAAMNRAWAVDDPAKGKEQQ